MAVYCSGTEKEHVMPETIKSCIAFFKSNHGVSSMPFKVFLEYDLSTKQTYLKYSIYKLLRKQIMSYLSVELKNIGLYSEIPTRIFGIDIYSQYCEFKLRSYKVKNGKFVKDKKF